MSWSLADTGFTVNVNIFSKNGRYFETDGDKWVLFTSIRLRALKSCITCRMFTVEISKVRTSDPQFFVHPEFQTS